MQFRLDQLGKNILRDFFGRVGAAETEVEVPPGDAQRIDVWLVPNPDLLKNHPEIEPGPLRLMAKEGGIVELWSAAPDTGDFHDCARKRYQWHHTLELRFGRRMPLPTAWFISAGRPDTVIRDFGFGPDPCGLSGVYATGAPGWRVRIVVIGELRRERATLLLRLLGSPRVRRQALQDLAGLPEDAWEHQVALPWLVRLSFELPAELMALLPAKEKDAIMDAQKWIDEVFVRGKKEAETRGRHLTMARLCKVRLGRPLTEAEHLGLTERINRLGEDRVGEAFFALSPEALSAWLADPSAA
jgi:hypothetical protein